MEKMSIIEGAVLGLVQGLTEFIPVSSSGHLIIAQHFFSGASDHLFIEWIDIGTLLALVVYFRHRLAGILRDVFVNRNYRLARNVLLTALPAGAIGFFFARFIESTAFFGSLVTVTIALGGVGVIMILLEKLPKLSPLKGSERLSAKRALVIGVVQVLALIPGVSRSGSTIIAGRLMGLNPAQAAEYSFLVSLPIMSGLMVKLLSSDHDRQYFLDHLPQLVVGNIVAFCAGIFAVSFMINYLSRHGLALFGWYRVALATVITVVLLIQSTL
jgi:undecaprenyl-diphosphatase